MTRPVVAIEFREPLAEFDAGDAISGSYHVLLPPHDTTSTKVIEISILWRTEGKGDEDISIFHFDRREIEPDARRPVSGVFQARLPASPLTYDGVLIKIRWLVKVRAFFEDGRELVGEKPFRLGRIPPARSVEKEPEPGDASEGEGPHESGDD